ncbi:MAG: phage portal protein [Planctomycetia bacterium]|nr:phage portal protein [Planctomycetia bacterium]
MTTSNKASYSAGFEQRLAEAFDDLWSGVVDRNEPLFDDGDGAAWMMLGAKGGPAGSVMPGFADEHQLAAIRNECRALALSNEFAVNGHENRVSYIVGSGHTYRATGKKHRSTPPELVADVQSLLDEFVRVNRWHRRQQEIVLRNDRDGESFLRYFVGSGGMTFVRFVEPGQVYAPAEAVRDPSLSYGIATDHDDVETVHAYYIDGVPVDADEIQHRKSNVDANVKRGLPLYYPVRKNLRRAEKLLRNMSTVAEIQSAIALIRKHRTATRTAVQQYVAAQPDSVTASGSARPTTMRRFAPGTILDTYGNVDYDFPASALDASSYVAILQAELRAIAARLVMPEFMLSSDASNANYASTFVAESPALRMFERLQAEQIGDDREVLRRVVRNAIGAGRLPSETLNLVEIQIEPPSLAMRDVKSEADVRAVEYKHGILSPQTWCLLSGLDYDQEQTNLRDHTRRQSAAPNDADV